MRFLQTQSTCVARLHSATQVARATEDLPWVHSGYASGKVDDSRLTCKILIDGRAYTMYAWEVVADETNNWVPAWPELYDEFAMLLGLVGPEHDLNAVKIEGRYYLLMMVPGSS